MIGSHFSLILLPTNKCNVACEYCFEDKTADFMSHEQLSVVMEKLFDHMEYRNISALTIIDVQFINEVRLNCDYLSICHGGCPVRTYSITDKFFVKDRIARSTKRFFQQWRVPQLV